MFALIIQVDAVEVRFDYMGTSVLMGRISHLSAAINDDWHVTDMGALSQTTVVRPAQGRKTLLNDVVSFTTTLTRDFTINCL